MPSTRAAPHGVEIRHPAPCQGENPHILMNSPPLDMWEKWFAGSTGLAPDLHPLTLRVID
jgi:hypothetical protein